jgi:hypothetical protein
MLDRVDLEPEKKGQVPFSFFPEMNYQLLKKAIMQPDEKCQPLQAQGESRYFWKFVIKAFPIFFTQVREK